MPHLVTTVTAITCRVKEIDDVLNLVRSECGNMPIPFEGVEEIFDLKYERESLQAKLKHALRDKAVQWINEDLIPPEVTDAEYDAAFPLSQIRDGVRMFPHVDGKLLMPELPELFEGGIV